MRVKIPKEKRRIDAERGVKHRSPLSKATSVAVSALLALAMFPIAAVADDEVSEAPEAPIEMQKNLETQSVDNDSNRQTDDVGDSTAVEQPKGSSSVSNETPEVEDTSESGDSAEGESKAGKAEKHPGRGVKSQTVSFEFQHASVTIGSQDGLTLSKSEAFEAAADRELRFDAVADDGL